QQALVNLIDNAIKHSAKGETVTVGLEAGSQRSEARGQKSIVSPNSQPSTLNLFVSDSGPGIPVAEHEKIFERFYRLGSELIIEDEAPMRTALADLLASEGYRALTAADGESGLERALSEKPDLILLDVMMPKLDGFAVCAELRRVSNSVPVLMLTAKGQIED